jgi:hypothetical protein
VAWGGHAYDEVNKKWKELIYVGFELAEKMTDGKPFMVSKRYTRSMHEKAILRKDLAAWRGRDFTADELKGFDLSMIIGKNCLLNLVENKSEATGKTYTNIAGITPPIKGMPSLAVTSSEPPAWVKEAPAKNLEKWGPPPSANSKPVEEAAPAPMDPAEPPF